MKKIIIEDIEFPQTLRDIEKPPKQLYYEGNINLLKQTSIAVIGSRCCSEYGVKMCTKFSSELAEAGRNYKWNGKGNRYGSSFKLFAKWRKNNSSFRMRS